jgi:hypothetical protein
VTRVCAVEGNERSSKYFFSRIKVRAKSVLLTELLDTDGSLVTETDAVLGKIHDLYALVCAVSDNRHFSEQVIGPGPTSNRLRSSCCAGR